VDHKWIASERAPEQPIDVSRLQTSRRPCGKAIFVSLVLILLPHTQLIAQQKPNDVLDPVFAVWQRRQETVRSAKFELSMHQRIPKGAYTRRGAKGAPAPSPNPPNDVAIDWKEQFMFDGDKMRWTHDRPMLVEPEWAPTSQTFVATFNGEMSKSLTLPAGASPVSGEIREERGVPETEAADVRPLMYAFRSDHPMIPTLNRKHLRLIDERPIVDGRSCIAVKTRSSQLWLDRERNYVVVREYIEQKGKVTFDLTIDYDRHRDTGWIPTGWKSVLLKPDGAMLNYLEAQVTVASINATIPPEQFEIVFPAGSYVADAKERRDAVVNADGDLETTARWSSPGQQVSNGAKHSAWYAGAVAIVTAAVVLLVRRGRRRVKGQQD
jgi:hypothetical protein